MFIKDKAKVASQWVVLSEEFIILASCLLSLMSRNSVLAVFTVQILQ